MLQDLESDSPVSPRNTGDVDDNDLIDTTNEHCPFEAIKNIDNLDNTVFIKGSATVQGERS